MAHSEASSQQIVEQAARRHGISVGAAEAIMRALIASGGSQAQFSHPDLGGMGQWSRGGMTQIGDMFNNQLKAKVDALCEELSGHVREGGLSQSTSRATGHKSDDEVSLSVPSKPSDRWPADLGSPGSSGSQNDLHYAVFPEKRRLAIERDGQVTVYDTADHAISGFSQQQSGDQSLTFTSQHGVVRVADLKVIGR